MDQEEPNAVLPKQKSVPSSTQVDHRWLWVVRLGTIPPMLIFLWIPLFNEEIMPFWFLIASLLLVAPYLLVLWRLMQPNQVDSVDTGLWLALVWGGGFGGMLTLIVLGELLEQLLRGSLSFLAGALMLLWVLSHGALTVGAIKVLRPSKWRRRRVSRGVVEAVVIFVCLVVLVMMASNSVESCCGSNGASAISSMRNIATSQITYQATIGQGSYAPDLATLFSSKLIDSVLGAGTKDGYMFFLTGDGSKFSIVARPEIYEETGNRSFYSDESGVVRYNTGDRPATVEDKPLGQ